MQSMQLVVVSFRQCTEDSHRNGSDDQRTSESLHEDGVLDLPKSRLLDPDFAIKDFTDNVAFFVFGDPRLVFIAIGAAESVERTFPHVHRGFVVIFGKKLPWAEMAMMHAMEDLERIRDGSLAFFQG